MISYARQKGQGCSNFLTFLAKVDEGNLLRTIQTGHTRHTHAKILTYNDGACMIEALFVFREFETPKLCSLFLDTRLFAVCSFLPGFFFELREFIISNRRARNQVLWQEDEVGDERRNNRTTNYHRN